MHTREGLVPIEKIKVGDWVLSQSEQVGELTYKQVEETFVNDSAEVWLVEYRVADQSYESWDDFDNWKWADEWMPKDENNELEIGYFVATSNHPVWLKGVGWARVDQISWSLNEGSSVLLTKDGRSLVVHDSRILYQSAQEGIGFAFSPATGDPGPFVDWRDDKLVFSELSQKNIDLAMRKRDFLEHPANLRVHGISVAEFSTYYIGKEGIWVHDTIGSS